MSAHSVAQNMKNASRNECPMSIRTCTQTIVRPAVRSGDRGDELERERLEALTVLPHAADSLGELRQRFPGLLRVEALPRREAHVPLRLVEVADEAEDAGAGHLTRPLDEGRPGLDERIVLAVLHEPGAARVRLGHAATLQRRQLGGLSGRQLTAPAEDHPADEEQEQ